MELSMRPVSGTAEWQRWRRAIVARAMAQGFRTVKDAALFVGQHAAHVTLDLLINGAHFRECLIEKRFEFGAVAFEDVMHSFLLRFGEV